MKLIQLNHVALHVRDVESSCAFYTHVLQLESIPRPAFDFPGAWFRLSADQELHLIGRRDGPVTSRNRGNHYALLVDDIDAWERHLIEVGADALPRNIRPDGANQIFIADPDGHYVELCTVPGGAG